MATTRERLFGAVKFWTIVTTVFAWLPLVRIVGKPEGYEWGLFGLRGSGTEGPYWIFILLTLYALTMLYTGFRGPRRIFHPMLLGWHIALTGMVIAGAVIGGPEASWQGQGLSFSFPLAVLSLPFLAFTAAAVAWVVLDRRHGDGEQRPEWTAQNTRRLAVGLALLPLVLLLFRAGTNYDWVTATAIVVAVVHWIVIVTSFEPPKLRQAAG